MQKSTKAENCNGTATTARAGWFTQIGAQFRKCSQASSWMASATNATYNPALAVPPARCGNHRGSNGERMMQTKTWKNRMEAIVAGAVDYDEMEAMALQCAAIADRAMLATQHKRTAEAKARGGMDTTPLWSELMPVLVDSLQIWRGGELSGGQVAINRNMIRCGEVADYILAGGAND